MSSTESEAIEAGDTWWDAALFSGNPDWSELLSCACRRMASSTCPFSFGDLPSLAGKDQEPLFLLETAFRLAHEVEPILRRLRQQSLRKWRTAPEGALTAIESGQLHAAEEAVGLAIMVDDFAAEDLTASVADHEVC